MERVMGIEPTSSAWEAEVLPLNYTRKMLGWHRFYSRRVLRVTVKWQGPLSSLTLRRQSKTVVNAAYGMCRSRRKSVVCGTIYR